MLAEWTGLEPFITHNPLIYYIKAISRGGVW
jgi:hypothetical protein